MSVSDVVRHPRQQLSPASMPFTANPSLHLNLEETTVVRSVEMREGATNLILREGQIGKKLLKKLICLESKSTTLHRGKTLPFLPATP